jgi:DNA-directed RNA polymerase specialized sigma24 family protein
VLTFEVSFAPRRKVAGPDIDALVERTLAGDGEAWQELWQTVEPTLYATLRRPRLLGRLSQSEDDCRNIVVEVMGRLRAGDFSRLQQYVAAKRQNAALPFMGWLVVVAKRVAIDYLRAVDTYIDRRHMKDASSPGAWREVVSLPNDSQLPGARPPVTGRSTAHELLAFAGADLPEVQRAALSAWLEGAGFEEIAAGGDPREPAKQVRAALERIRRRFREPKP